MILRSVRAWFDPLWIARRSLRCAIRKRADQPQGRLLDLGCGTQPYQVLFKHVQEHSHLFTEVATVSWLGFGLDRLCGKKGDALDRVLLARKPDGTTP